MSIFDNPGKEEAIEEIQRYIRNHEPLEFSDWQSWYVGITNDPNRRLYEEHRAFKHKSIYVAVESEAVARSVEKFLIEITGITGNPGGGEIPNFVYAFKMRPDTVPPLCRPRGGSSA